MSIHNNILFPENLSFGTRGGAGFSTTIKLADSGVERRSNEWENHRGRVQYDVAKSVQTEDDLAELLDFYMCMRGSACAFRFKDPADFTSSYDGTTVPTRASMGRLHQMQGTVDGSNRVFFFNKTYGNATKHSFTTTWWTRRVIHLPIPPGDPNHAIYIAWNGGLIWKSDGDGDGAQVSGLSASVDYDHGRVIFQSPPPLGTSVSAAFTFHVPARFGQEADDGLNISWDEPGQFSIATVPIVEVTSQDPTGPEEWLYGGHKSEPAPTGYIQSLWDPPDKLTQVMFREYVSGGNNSWVSLPDFSNRASPISVYFRGGPYTLIYNSATAGTSHLLISWQELGRTSSRYYRLRPLQYIELYWFDFVFGGLANPSPMWIGR